MTLILTDIIIGMREQSITHTQSEGWRSTASIWAVVKSHSPGLRHLYNQHLRTHPGLQGKVSVRFGIDARGTVVSAEIEGSTTGYDRFDEAIEEKRREERARERREEEARDRAHHELMERRRAEAREASATAEYERRLCGDDDAHEAADAHLDPDHGVHSGQ